MKKSIGILLAIVCVAGLASYSSKDEPLATTQQKQSIVQEDVNKVIFNTLNSTYKIDNTLIKLINGKAEIEVVPGSASKIITTVWKQPTVGNLNSDNSEDSAVVLIQQAGGSGTFYYIAANVSTKEGKYIGTNPILLGDRIDPESIKIDNGKISVSYLDRKESEPMSTKPSVEKTKTFLVDGNSLSEDTAVTKSQSYEDAKNSFEQYFDLLGLSNEKLMNTLNEQPVLIDEGGLEFKKAGIRVWFKDYGIGMVVDQIYVEKKDVDYNGIKVGDKISSFKKIFGNPVREDKSSAYCNFKYKEKFLSVNYDPKREETISIYILRNDFE